MKLNIALLLTIANSSTAFQVNNLASPRARETLSFTVQTISANRLYASTDDDLDEIEKKHEESDEEGATDILNSPAFLKRKLELLKEDISKVEKDCEEMALKVEEGKAEWGEKMDKLEKEYKNIQERSIKMSSESGGQALIDVTRKVLDVVDNFDRAFMAVTPSNDEESAVEAEYKKAYESMLSTFKTLGITEVETVGKEFDYEEHSAVFTKPSEYEEGIVCEQLQTGWKLGDKLIRPAMVVVTA
jgi:molecular chaperone GrpE